MATTVSQHQLTAVTTPIPGGPLSADVVRTNDNTTITQYNAHDADPGIHLQTIAGGSLPAVVNGAKVIFARTIYEGIGGQWVAITGTAFSTVNGQPPLYDAGNSGTSLAINWNNSPVQKVTLTGNATLTFTNPIAGGTFTLVLVQDGTGGRSVTLTGWEFGDNTPTFNTGAGKKNVVSGLYDGTEYLAAFAVSGG
jgi:hypothetical protein